MQNFAKITFFNYYGIGDLFNSREFVRDVMRQAPNKVYEYDHGKPSNVFEDIGLKKATQPSPCIATTPTKIHNDTLYINTWIGRNSSYVLPGIGCKISQNKRMFNDLLNQYGFKFEGEGQYYWPAVDWENISDIYRALRWTGKLYDRQLVIICNGHVNSHQAHNFDFQEPMKHVVSKYKNTVFLETHRSGLVADNLHYTGDVFKYVKGSDVNYISFLACNSDRKVTVIGRSSGPFTTSMTRNFLNKPSKKALTFVKHPNAAYFVDNVNEAKARLNISLAKEQNEIIQEMERIIDE